MGKIILSAFSDEYSRDIDRQIEALKTLGFTHMEPRFLGDKNVADLTEEEAVQLRRALDEAGILVSAIGSPIGKISIDDDFDAHLAMAERTFRTANILGAKNIRMFSFYFPEDKTREQVRDAVIERLEALLDLADKYGVTLCHENEARIYGESAEYCLDLLQHFGGRLRCVFDMGNFVLDGCEPYPHAYSLLSEYIEYFHIKDSFPEGAIVPPGLGKASIRELLAAHKARGGDFIITLEPHLQLFSGLNALTDSRFENPYKFETQEAAFTEAARLIKEIVNSL